MKVVRKKYRGAKFVTAEELVEIIAANQMRTELALTAGLFVAHNRERYGFPKVEKLNKQQMSEYIENLLDIVDETMDVMNNKVDDLNWYYSRMCEDYFTPDDEVVRELDYQSGALSRLYLYTEKEKAEAAARALAYYGSQNSPEDKDPDSLPF